MAILACLYDCGRLLSIENTPAVLDTSRTDIVGEVLATATDQLYLKQNNTFLSELLYVATSKLLTWHSASSPDPLRGGERAWYTLSAHAPFSQESQGIGYYRTLVRSQIRVHVLELGLYLGCIACVCRGVARGVHRGHLPPPPFFQH